MSRVINIRRSILALSCGSILASSVAAEPQLYDLNGTKNNDRLGDAVANVGDIDGDGFNDILGGAPENGNLFALGEGFATLYSGVDGSVIFTMDGDPNGASFGSSVAGNVDVNNDGTLDLVIGAPYSDVGGLPGSGYVSVRSGVDGSEILGLNGQTSQEFNGLVVAGLGDLNGDGFDEFAASSSMANSDRGVVNVYDGQTGLELYQFDGSFVGNRLGISMSRIGDINNDGVADILIGTSFDGYYAYSGATGLEIRHTVIPGEDSFGITIARISDLSGDGIDDIIVGATQYSVFSPGPGRVYVINGSTGSTLFMVDGAVNGNSFGEAVAEAGDWNLDGATDFMVTSNPQFGPNFVGIHSGIDGAELDQYLPDASGDDLGRSLAALGDIDGDGKVEVALGAPQVSASFIFEGLIRVYKSPFDACGNTSVYCNALPNSTGAVGTISTVGSTSIGDQALILQSSGLPNNVSGLFYYGDLVVDIPFGDGVRCVGGNIQRLVPVPTNAAGFVSTSLFFDPNNSIAAPGVFYFQYWHRDPPSGPGHFNFSKAIEINFCP